MNGRLDGNPGGAGYRIYNGIGVVNRGPPSSPEVGSAEVRDAQRPSAAFHLPDVLRPARRGATERVSGTLSVRRVLTPVASPSLSGFTTLWRGKGCQVPFPF